MLGNMTEEETPGKHSFVGTLEKLSVSMLLAVWKMEVYSSQANVVG